MTYNELRRQILLILRPVLEDEAMSTSRMLMCDVLNLSQTQLLMKDNDNADAEIVQRLLDMAQRLTKHEPLQYVTNKAYFYGHEFYVDSRVLIPRPETEVLTEEAIKVIGKEASVADFCTGSGCIAISIKSACQDARVMGIDISNDALEVAMTNAQRLGVEVCLACEDALAPRSMYGPFDVIVSNPPYVCERERADMQSNVLDYEPHIALFVPDTDPLRFYRAIAKKGADGLLRPDGHLLFEINEAYSVEMKDMLISLGYHEVVVLDDMYGKPRVCHAIR